MVSEKIIEGKNGCSIKSAIFFIGIWALVLKYGIWTGQAVTASPNVPAKNGTFLLIFASISVCIYFISLRSLNLNFKHCIIFMVLFFNLLIICFFRDDIMASFRNAAAIILTYCIALFLASILHSMELMKSIKLYTWTLVSIIPFTVYVHITSVHKLVLFPDRKLDNIYRLGGLFFYSDTAMLCGLICILCFWIALNLKFIYNSFIYIIIFIAAFLALLYTDARSVWLACISSFFIIFKYSYHYSKKLRLYFYMFIILLPMIYIFFIYFFTLPTGLKATSDLYGRSRIWALSVKGIVASPFIGYGSKSYLSTSPEALRLNKKLYDSHSALISLALQSGLISVTLFLILYGIIIKNFIQNGLTKYKSMISIPLFWFIAPFFWGDPYNGTAGLIQTLFPMTMIAILCHPDIIKKTNNEIKDPIPIIFSRTKC